MFDIFNESEDFSMDVQVGPEKEIRADTNDSPVTIAKKNPDTVCVAGKKNTDGVCEFFVEAEDVINLARLNEESILESMNRIIECNESEGVTAQNLIMVMAESNMGYADELESRGVNCMRIVSEAEMEDISMDVQVGPNGDEVRVSEDPQEANPVDAVKRQYNSVVVAKDGDNFFTDVEDVQKCADLNCESMIETLNGIIAANEDAGVEASNLVVVVSEDTNDYIINTLNESNVNYICEASKNFKAEKKYRKNAMRRIATVINNFFKDVNARTAHVEPTWWFNNNSDFIHCRSNNMEFEVNDNNGTTTTMSTSGSTNDEFTVGQTTVTDKAAHEAAIAKDIKAFNSHKNNLEERINKVIGKGNTIKNLKINRDAVISMNMVSPE